MCSGATRGHVPHYLSILDFLFISCPPCLRCIAQVILLCACSSQCHSIYRLQMWRVSLAGRRFIGHLQLGKTTVSENTCSASVNGSCASSVARTDFPFANSRTLDVPKWYLTSPANSLAPKQHSWLSIQTYSITAMIETSFMPLGNEIPLRPRCQSSVWLFSTKFSKS